MRAFRHHWAIAGRPRRAVMIFESRLANQNSNLQAGKDKMNSSRKIGFMESMNLGASAFRLFRRLGRRRQRPLVAGGAIRTFLVAGIAGITQVVRNRVLL